ncbi:MAG: O-antigen ligase family protein [Bacteroidota bacterium]
MDEGALVNPFLLSYSSALLIVLTIYGKLTDIIKNNFVLICCVLVAVPAFAIGASRGPIIAILLSLFLYYIYSENIIKGWLKSISIFIVALFLVNLVSIYFQTALFDRFSSLLGIFDSTSGSEFKRIRLWADSFLQFSENPILGNNFENIEFRDYPHNIIIESLISVGLIGTLPLVVLIMSGFSRLSKILRGFSTNSKWIVGLFVVGFVHAMFSGTIYTNHWFWAGLALILNQKFKKWHY